MKNLKPGDKIKFRTLEEYKQTGTAAYVESLQKCDLENSDSHNNYIHKKNMGKICTFSHYDKLDSDFIFLNEYSSEYFWIGRFKKAGPLFLKDNLFRL